MGTKIKRIIQFLLVILAVAYLLLKLVYPTIASANLAAARGNHAGHPGYSGKRYPVGHGATRHQRLYNVNPIPFGPGAAQGGIATALNNIRIDLSTTQAYPSLSSAAFADNDGSNNTSVYSGVQTLASSSQSIYGFNYSGIVIYPQIPFFYIPSQGNLWLDFGNYQAGSGGSIYYFDATYPGYPYIYFVYGNSASGGMAGSNGSPVPIPAAFWLFGTGLIVLFSFRKKIKK